MKHNDSCHGSQCKSNYFCVLYLLPVMVLFIQAHVRCSAFSLFSTPVLSLVNLSNVHWLWSSMYRPVSLFPSIVACLTRVPEPYLLLVFWFLTSTKVLMYHDYALFFCVAIRLLFDPCYRLWKPPVNCALMLWTCVLPELSAHYRSTLDTSPSFLSGSAQRIYLQDLIN